MKSSFHGHLPPDSLAAGIPKFTSVPAVVRVSVMWTVGSGIELNHFKIKRKKSIFSCSFPLPKAESNDWAVPHSQHRCCCSQRRAHRQVSRILGCSQIIFGEEQEAAGQTFGEICRYKPCRATAAALEQDTE